MRDRSLLELGFANDLTAILPRLPPKRQTLLFSATMSRALLRLQKLALNAPHVADLAPLVAVQTPAVETIAMAAQRAADRTKLGLDELRKAEEEQAKGCAVQ